MFNFDIALLPTGEWLLFMDIWRPGVSHPVATYMVRDSISYGDITDYVHERERTLLPPAS